MNFSRNDHKIAVFLIALVFLFTTGGGAAFHYKDSLARFFKKIALTNVSQQKEEVVEVKNETTQPEVVAVTTTTTPPAITKDPPKHSGTGKIAGTTTSNSDGSKTVIVSDNSTNPTELSEIAKLGPASSIRVLDETGNYPTLGDTLKNYMNERLLTGSEVPYLYQIIIRDAGNTNWEGQYSGSYKIDASGKIVSAFGYIILNVYRHKDEPEFVDFMKLTLAHEYGHHYTLYHKWVDLNLSASDRFPDSYYNTRPLSKTTTAIDYSLEWQNCESEIIAEDYSYFYSGYGYHAMKDTYGYPSAATKTWLVNLGSASSPATETPPASTPPPAAPPAETPAEPTEPITTDTEKPVITILNPLTNPADWTTGDFLFEVSATDNVAVTKIRLYNKNRLLDEQSGPYYKNWAEFFEGGLGTYVFKIRAYDAAGNMAESIITINKK